LVTATFPIPANKIFTLGSLLSMFIHYNQVMILDYFKSRSSGVVRFLRRVLESFESHKNSKSAAAIAYYTLFSIFPLLLFVLYGASFIFNSAESRQVLSTYLQGLFPYGAENLSEIIEETWRARGSIGVVSGIALLWGGSSIFSVLEVSLSQIWNTLPRPFYRRRLLGILAVITLMIIFIISFFVGPLTSLLLDNSGLSQQTMSYLIEMVSLTIVLMLLYRIFPNATVHWGAAFSGAFSATVLVMIAKFGFRLYTILVIQRSGLLYGSLTWFLILALWVYLLAVLTLFGAEFAATFQQRQRILAALAQQQNSGSG
jgi:membrane protein